MSSIVCFLAAQAIALELGSGSGVVPLHSERRQQGAVAPVLSHLFQHHLTRFQNHSVNIPVFRCFPGARLSRLAARTAPQAASLVSPTYMQRQTDINERMRSILNDWLIEVSPSGPAVKESRRPA